MPSSLPPSAKSFSGTVDIINELLELNVSGSPALQSTNYIIGSSTLQGGSTVQSLEATVGAVVTAGLTLRQSNQVPATSAISFQSYPGQSITSLNVFELYGFNQTIGLLSATSTPLVSSTLMTPPRRSALPR